MANKIETPGRAALSDQDLLELLDWRPDLPGWRQEWMHVHERAPANGWNVPAPAWIEWARQTLCQPLSPWDEQAMIARILVVAEVLHPQGLDHQRLQQALVVLGQLHGHRCQLAERLVDFAERNGAIRYERLDLWRPGMRSGSGWRTFCRLTLFGKSLINAGEMPDPFPPPADDPFSFTAPVASPAAGESWWEREQKRLVMTSTPSEDTQAVRETVSPIPGDFAWRAPFVDQQVHKFFRRHWEEYASAIQAVVNEQEPMEQFSLDFGPKRISTWINEMLGVGEDHPRPCLKQHVNGSATYKMLVKAFKTNPREHAVVKRLQAGQSEEAQSILDAFLGAADGEP